MNRAQLLLAASACAGFAAATLAALVQRSVLRPRPTGAAAWEFETSRRLKLSAGNSTFRWFEPLVDELAARHRRRNPVGLEKIGAHLTSLNTPLPWKPEEYVAAKQLESAIGGLFGFGLGYVLGGVLLGLLLGGLAFFVLTRMAVHDLGEKAGRRTSIVKRRLPFAVDLLALMLQAGGGLLESLKTLVTDLRGHPLGLELETITEEIRLGRSLRESLVRFQQRVPDDDVAELVFSINKGEEFGTPLAQTFRIQADQMRLKRTQWAEKAAGAAQVAIVLPGMIIMIACLLIIGAPFVLSALYLP